MDSEYVKRTLGVSLIRCLADVNAVRPDDPIDYMAAWLHNDANNDHVLGEIKQREAAKQQAINQLMADAELRKKMADERVTFEGERAKMAQLAEEQKRQQEALALQHDSKMMTSARASATKIMGTRLQQSSFFLGGDEEEEEEEEHNYEYEEEEEGQWEDDALREGDDEEEEEEAGEEEDKRPV